LISLILMGQTATNLCADDLANDAKCTVFNFNNVMVVFYTFDDHDGTSLNARSSCTT